MLPLYFFLLIIFSLVKINLSSTQSYAQIFLNLNQTIIDLHPDEQCKCYMFGTQESAEGLSICSPVTLQCKCLPHVEGLNCDRCEQGFYNILSGKGCASCDCDVKGTLPDTFCDQKGRCKCKRGYKGFRCNLKDDRNVTDFYYGRCPCQDVILSQLNKLSNNLDELCQLMDNGGFSGNAAFESQLKQLKYLIQRLLSETLNEKGNKIQANFQKMFEEFNRINAEIRNISKQIPNWSFQTNYASDVKDAEELIKICQKRLQEASNSNNHNEELSNLAKKAVRLAQQLQNLPDLIGVVVSSYNDAIESIYVLEANLKILKESYATTKNTYDKIQRKLQNVSFSAQSNKQTAMENKKLLEDVWFPFENTTKLIYYYNLTDGSFIIPEDIERQLDIVIALQSKLNFTQAKLENLLARAEKAVNENAEDVEIMKTIFKNYLKLIDKVDIDAFLELQSLSNTNKNELQILENELKTLIQRLEYFIKQINELERLNNENEELLKELQDLLLEYQGNLQILKELEAFFDALPLSSEQLDVVEAEISKAEKYFALLEEKENLEKEVRNVEAIVRELDALGDVRDLCDNGVKPEGLG